MKTRVFLKYFVRACSKWCRGSFYYGTMKQCVWKSIFDSPLIYQSYFFLILQGYISLISEKKSLTMKHKINISLAVLVSAIFLNIQSLNIYVIFVNIIVEIWWMLRIFRSLIFVPINWFQRFTAQKWSSPLRIYSV